MTNKYMYLQIDADDIENYLTSGGQLQSGLTIEIKMDDEGVVADVWCVDAKTEEETCMASTYKLYNEFDVEVTHKSSEDI